MESINSQNNDGAIPRAEETGEGAGVGQLEFKHGPLIQAPHKPMTSDTGLGHAKVKTTWPCSPKSHCFSPKTPTLLEVGGVDGARVTLNHHTEFGSRLPFCGLEEGKSALCLFRSNLGGKVIELVKLLMLKFGLFQPSPFCSVCFHIHRMCSPKQSVTLSPGHTLDSRGEL